MKYIIPIIVILSIVIGLRFQSNEDGEIENILNGYKQENKTQSLKIQEVKEQQKLASMTGWERFTSEALRLAKQHGFAPQVPIAQCALESHKGTSSFALNRNNFCGLGAFDSNPDNAMRFESPEECAQYWVLLISKRYKQAWNNRTDPLKMLSYIKDGGYASDPNYVSKVLLMPEFYSY